MVLTQVWFNFLNPALCSGRKVVFEAEKASESHIVKEVRKMETWLYSAHFLCFPVRRQM